MWRGSYLGRPTIWQAYAFDEPHARRLLLRCCVAVCSLPKGDIHVRHRPELVQHDQGWLVRARVTWKRTEPYTLGWQGLYAAR